MGGGGVHLVCSDQRPAFGSCRRSYLSGGVHLVCSDRRPAFGSCRQSDFNWGGV